MKKSPTIKDIARKAGVNISTVSRALADHPHISEDKKKQIRKLAADLNYHRNDLAKSLRVKKTHVIGLIIPDIQNPFYPSITRIIEDQAQERGYNILLCHSDFDPQKENNYLSVLLSRQIDGLIIFPTLKIFRNNKRGIVAGKKIPTVFLDTAPLPGIEGNYVFTDNKHGSYLAVKYLLENGHKSIVLFTSEKGLLSSLEQMEEGYIQAFREAGIRVQNKCIFRGELEEKKGLERSVKKLLNKKKSINYSAIICNSDVVARVIYEQAALVDINIPDSLSVVGYDNTFLCSYLDPPLTSVHQPGDALGHQAINILISQIQSEIPWQYRTVSFTPELVVRNSVKQNV